MVGRVVRYLGGAVAAWIAFTAQGVIVYLGLLVYALITGADAGGPLAGPFIVLLAAVLGAILIPVLYVPTVVVVEIAGRRVGLPGRILAAAAGIATLVGVIVAVVAILTDLSLGAAVLVWLVGLASVLLPSAAATGVAYGTSGLAMLLSRWRASRRPTSAGVHTPVQF